MKGNIKCPTHDLIESRRQIEMPTPLSITLIERRPSWYIVHGCIMHINDYIL